MWFELTVALRHLTSRKLRSGLISVITGISVLGVVVGVTALIAVIAVMDGAQEDYTERLIDQYSHMEIRPVYTETLPHYMDIVRIIEEDPEVEAVSPVLKRHGLLKRTTSLNFSQGARPVQIMGIDPDRESEVTRFARTNERHAGERVPGPGEVVLGKYVAQMMRAQIGDTLYAMTGQVAQTATGFQAKQVPLKVVGIFETGIFEVDQSVAYVSLQTSQDMNLIDDEVDLLHLRLSDPYRANLVRDRVAAALKDKVDVPCRLMTWQELNPELFAALRLEKLGMYVILMLVILVAGLNIIGTLILVTMEKTREIGILRAMGTSRRSISRIFIWEGGLIGLTGTGLGIVCGLALCYWLKYHFPIDLPEEVYMLDGLPVRVKWQTIAIISACSMSISLLSSLIPALRAARLNVVEALRYE